MSFGSLEIIYRDETIIAVDKPAGLLVHRGYGRDPITLCDILRHQLQLAKIHALHRLDRQTSGVLLFGLDSEIARALADDFRNHRISKRYIALVRGVFPDKVTVDHPVPKSEGGARVDAQTEFLLLGVAQTEPRYLSLVEARPRTGRFHQIRRHLKHINHPIIGDANYGKGPLNREIRARYGLERLALHAAELKFVHPKDGKLITLTAPTPNDLALSLARMGFRESSYSLGTLDGQSDSVVS